MGESSFVLSLKMKFRYQFITKGYRINKKVILLQYFNAINLGDEFKKRKVIYE